MPNSPLSNAPRLAASPLDLTKRAAAASRVGRRLCRELALRRECDREKPRFPTGGRSQLEPDGHAGAIAPDRHCDRAQPEIIDRDGVADDAAVHLEVAIGVRDFGHWWRGEAQCRRGDYVDGVETRRRSTRQGTNPSNAGQVVSRIRSLRVAHRRRNDRIELRQPVRSS